MSDLANELRRYDPPDVPLRLVAEGPGSRDALVDYVQSVIDERTTVNDDTTAERLAEAVTTSILSRLGAGYSIATGAAWIALVPAERTERAADPSCGHSTLPQYAPRCCTPGCSNYAGGSGR